MDESSPGVTRSVRRIAPLLLLGLLLYWFAPTWVWHVRRTIDPFAFNDDARILIWPFFRDADPSLFPGDPYVPYYLSGLPEGYLALYRLVARWGWAKGTSEALQYLSVLTVAATLALTAYRIGGRVAAFVATALVLGSECFFERAGGGLPRAFAFPLVSLGLYALVNARPRMLAGLTIAGAAFYPVVAALLGLALLLLLVLPTQIRMGAVTRRVKPELIGATAIAPQSSSRERNSASAEKCDRWVARALLLCVTFLAVVALVVPMSLRLRDYGDPIGPAILAEYPEAGQGGRLTRDQHPPFEDYATLLGRHTRSALLGIGPPIGGRAAAWLRATDQKTNLLLAAVVLAAAIRMAVASRAQPNLLRPFLLPVAAAIGHELACLVAPRLFLPERYVQYAIPPFMVLLVASAIGVLVASDAGTRRATLRWCAAAFVLLALGGKGTSWVGIDVYVPPSERAMYGAIAALPKDSVIAGWPTGPLENVPYLSARRVLTNFQLEMPFHTRFTLRSRERLRALFEAYFAESPRPIERLCSEFEVTHLLVDSAHFSKAPLDYYLPHRADLERSKERLRPDAALLPKLLAAPFARRLSATYSLVDLAMVPELAGSCAKRWPNGS